MTKPATILDMCCGSRMFWFDKQDTRAVFTDIRAEQHTLCDGRHLIISPDLIADFRMLPFADASFSVVVFDPPHLKHVGPEGWQGKKYGKLNQDTWRNDLRDGFSEAFRVLRMHGVLIFKWNETQIPVREILALTGEKPLIRQRTGKGDKTHWIIFTKETGDDTCNLKSALLDSAYRRLHELESLLLPEVPETVWPAEVKMIFEQINNAESLPEHHQRRLKHHINRMWLEKMSVQAIVIAARSLMNAMEKYA
ncbi:TPA: class I SAM-dependent methyltransferase [Citrobacter freundii]|nr:class I SAM-dependent methyltransferase [Citrobacter freundii]HCB1432809.1 class I SAM-dependent methyltransferase [Citrobacter braakii]HAU6298602.1 class I SAM-dependent methyltransferase [Citrobacter freundii]HBC0545135.1 class I SAM-dependent methyltransferase [Citrobacter freundii]HCB1476019.1 class I SAM-dependent methyltransferase [Citrobacter braakii]